MESKESLSFLALGISVIGYWHTLAHWNISPLQTLAYSYPAHVIVIFIAIFIIILIAIIIVIVIIMITGMYIWFVLIINVY